MASIFALDSLGAKFSVKVTDCTGGIVPPAANVSDQKIIFYKPNGIKIEKDAILVVNSQTDYTIEYQNISPEASILDLVGNWEYAGKIKLVTDDTFQTSERFVFWVR